MKTRQHRAQILSFESGDSKEWRSFVEKNAILLRSFLLHFPTPIDADLQELCHSFGLLYATGTLPSRPNIESMQALDLYWASRRDELLKQVASKLAHLSIRCVAGRKSH